MTPATLLSGFPASLTDFFDYQAERGTMKAKILSQRRDIMIMYCLPSQIPLESS